MYLIIITVLLRSSCGKRLTNAELFFLQQRREQEQETTNIPNLCRQEGPAAQHCSSCIRASLKPDFIAMSDFNLHQQ